MRTLSRPAPVATAPSRPRGGRVRVAVLPDLAPGENARGSVSGAAWSYLLPDRELGTILSLGRPTEATRATLAKIGRELIVAPAGRLPGPLPAGSVGLVAVLDPWWTDRLAIDRKLGSDLERVIATDGSVFARLGRPARAKARAKARARAGSRAGAELPFGSGGEGMLWLGSSAGEIRAVVPAGEEPLIDFAMSLLDNEEAGTFVRRVAKRGVGRLRGRRFERELGVLQVPLDAGSIERPPRYIRVAAAAAGLSIDDRRWALVDPGSYSTKKLLLFLFRPGATEPDVVVKLVRDKQFNPRLEGAWRALNALAEAPPDVRGVGPAPEFFGIHAGLAFLGEAIVTGEPLKDALTGRPEDPLIAAVVDRLVGLGKASTTALTASPAEIGADLRMMFDRFAQLYKPTPPERKVLTAAIDRIAGHEGPFPLILQHGDAGTWNVVVRPGGRPVLIDWEAAVPHGMPLWDLLYFLRSAAVSTARRRGTRDPLVAFEEAFLVGDTPFSLQLADAVDRLCSGIGLERDLVEPVFYLCWMHRALKESSTLQPDRMSGGHYRKLLTLAIDRREAPGLQRVFGAAG